MANKKILVVSLIGARHIITEADLAANPDLVEKVKVGDEVELGPDPSALSRISELEKDLDKKTKVEKALELQVFSLNSDITTKQNEFLTLEKSFKEVSTKLNEANAAIANFGTENQPPVANSPKVKVNHGVVLNGKTYSKEQIKNDASIQEVLLDLKSSAVTAIEG
ncbi:hypothetical protein GCM10009120_18660 [Sphingobacterium siyangense subsp. cladoniae]|uniref:hypothetical protein n=1 Tax=Sphingobacterium siyangense TaxID=459529 RepID=UPI0031F7F2C7